MLGAVVASVTATMRVIEIILKKVSPNSQSTFTNTDKQNLRETRDWTKSLYETSKTHASYLAGIFATENDIKNELRIISNEVELIRRRELTIKCPLTHE